MKVVICGAGQVGYGIAERLASERNDVSIIDNSSTHIQLIRDNLDVRGIVGHGAHPDVLAQAGADDADMIIAVTLYDEVNMMACQVAHSLFNVPTKIARVRAQSYLQPHYSDLFSQDHMPIDVIISPEIEVGEMVLRRLALPGALDTVKFADRQITLLGILCESECPVVDTPLKQLSELFPGLSAVVVGILRQGKIFVPHSHDVMLHGDLAYVITPTERVQRTLSIFGHDEQEALRIVFAGGGNIGLYVARKLEQHYSKTKLKIIERERERAINIAEQLKRTVVLHGDALDRDILREAEIQDTDTMVTLTDNDEVNVLSCVMAKQMGCRRTLSLLNNTSYPAFTQSLGIDAHINPRVVTLSKILQHVRRGRVKGVYPLQDGKAEIIEAEALETSPIVGKPLRELELPRSIRIGAVVQNGRYIRPDGNTKIQAHDQVVIFALADHVRKVEQMFRVSIDYF